MQRLLPFGKIGRKKAEGVGGLVRRPCYVAVILNKIAVFLWMLVGGDKERLDKLFPGVYFSGGSSSEF